MNCDQIQELLEAYILGALDAEERVEVEQHLAGCPDCRRLAGELEEVISLLPKALADASELRPPEAMKQRLLLALEQEAVADLPATESRQAIVSEKRSASPALSHSLSTNGKANEVGQKLPPWRSLFGRRLRAVSILAVLLLLLLSVFLGTRLSIVLAQERALRAELANLFGQQEVVLEVVDSQHTIKRILLPPDSESSRPNPPYGKLYTRPDLPHVVTMIARLPQPPAGQAYHLWLTQEGQIKLAGLMEVNEQGFSLLAFDADVNGPTYEAAELTLQPIDSTTPSGEPILQWQASPE